MNAAPVNTRPADDWHYGPTARALHWLIALLLTGAAGVGWYMMSIEDEPGSGWYFATHKSVGIVIALLVVARLAWRLTHRPATLPPSVPAWQARLAGAVQVLLYIVMLLVPLAGYLGASYSKQGVLFFGITTPHWALPDHDTAERFFDIHSVLVWVLVALVAAHVLGALKHLWVDKDGVFQRMGQRAPR